MEDRLFLAVVGIFTLAIVGIVGGLIYSEHVKSMACLEKRGTVIRGSCIFITPTALPLEQQEGGK